MSAPTCPECLDSIDWHHANASDYGPQFCCAMQDDGTYCSCELSPLDALAAAWDAEADKLGSLDPDAWIQGAIAAAFSHAPEWRREQESRGRLDPDTLRRCAEELRAVTQ